MQLCIAHYTVIKGGKSLHTISWLLSMRTLLGVAEGGNGVVRSCNSCLKKTMTPCVLKSVNQTTKHFPTTGTCGWTRQSVGNLGTDRSDQMTAGKPVKHALRKMAMAYQSSPLFYSSLPQGRRGLTWLRPHHLPKTETKHVGKLSNTTAGTKHNTFYFLKIARFWHKLLNVRVWLWFYLKHWVLWGVS